MPRGLCASWTLPTSSSGSWTRGVVNNRAELARLHGISRARVTQVLALRSLHPELVRWLRDLVDTAPQQVPSERRLRALLRVPGPEQLRAAAGLWPSLAEDAVEGVSL